MQNTKRAVRSSQVACAGTYVKVEREFHSHMTMFVHQHGLLVSIGHATPADATSYYLHPATTLQVPVGIIGDVYVKSFNGTATIAHIAGA